MQADTERAVRVIVDADIRGVTKLHELLLVERGALVTRDAGRLEIAVQEKLHCLRALDANELQRRELLALQRTGDWQQLVQSMDPELAKQWSTLLERLREVAELSEANERIVNRTRRGASRLLALLRGQIDPVGVYDRSGRTLAYGDNRPITSA
jgi:flagellar biosynthesis/type III secretory pathway chaperone